MEVKKFFRVAWRTTAILTVVLLWQWVPNDIPPSVIGATVAGIALSRDPKRVGSYVIIASLAITQNTGPDWLKVVSWGTAQQWVLQETMVPELRAGLGETPGTIVASVSFGSMHLPSPSLAAGTAVFGAGTIKLYDKWPSLPLVGGAHAGATWLALQLDPSITNDLHTGRR